MYTLQPYKEQRTELLHLDLVRQPYMEDFYLDLNLRNNQDRSWVLQKLYQTQARLLLLQCYMSSEYCLDN
jgi:hypothetical protein